MLFIFPDESRYSREASAFEGKQPSDIFLAQLVLGAIAGYGHVHLAHCFKLLY
jgi:hypothetical protein